MTKIVTLAAALMIFGASTAMAAGGGINLFWDGCSDGGVSTKTFACDSNTGTAFTLYASLILPQDMPFFAATTAIIDIGVSAPSLPAWWQTLTGQCSSNRISVSYDSAGFDTNCPDIWQGQVNLSVFQAQPASGSFGPNFVRLNSAAAVPAGNELGWIADGSELVVCKVSIGRAKTVGTGSCAGCNVGACIVLNEIKSLEPGDYASCTITQPAVSNFATWQVGGPICPQATPTRSRTWGSVKNLYR